MSTTELMRERLEAVLQDEGAGRQQLARWLVEKDLPPRSGDEEPYVLILRALSALDEYAPAVRKLAGWVAALLDEQPEKKGPEPEGDQYLYNLLRLAAALASPDELWEALIRIYDRRKIAGEYDGLEHRTSLLLALAKNQADTRLRDIWLRMAKGEEEPLLGGAPEDGLWALMHAPEAEKGRGYPDLDGLGQAFNLLIANVLPDRSDRRRSLVQLCLQFCRRMVGLYENIYLNSQEELYLTFIRWADSFDWPSWAVTALPSLSVVTRRDEKAVEAFLWEVYKEKVFQESATILEEKCSRRVLLIRASSDAWKRWEPIVAVLEERRLTSPLGSERPLLGDLNQRLMELQSGLMQGIPDHSVLDPVRREFAEELAAGAGASV